MASVTPLSPVSRKAPTSPLGASSPTSPTSPPMTNGSQISQRGYAMASAPPATAPIIPTNNVTTKDGITVRARIDPTLTVDDVIRQLCLNLKMREPPMMYALRDENDELVTNENLRKKILEKSPMKLVNAPVLEAVSVVEKLNLRDERTWKMSLFSLQKFIKEEQFVKEFLRLDGLKELLDAIYVSHGNTLAYALTAMQNLMDLDYGWSTLDSTFILRVVQILSSSTSPINVCRPATAILKKLVEADPLSAPGPGMASSSRDPPKPQPGSVYRYGFDAVFAQMRKEKRLLETVVNRLGSADTAMVLYSMMLINSLLSHATDMWWGEFIIELERLKVRKAVVRLMSSHTIEDLTSCILDFQANSVRVTYRKKTTPVEPDIVPLHRSMLDYVWTSSKLAEETDPMQIMADDGSSLKVKWRKLGFESENMTREFAEVGLLGLHCLRSFVENDPDYFSRLVAEQLSRPVERRCPFAKASKEVVELLSEHWAIYAPGYSTSTTFQPFFLNLYKVHTLATNFFLRMWNESGATANDFQRVVALTRSQVKVALRRENVRPWHEVEADFMEAEYRQVRDRQMKELEEEDDLLSKVPVRNLRAKLYKESFEFVRQQRIQCLMQGAWFVTGMPVTAVGLRDNVRRPSRPWRFMRLDNGHKYLHFVDSAVKFPVRNGTEDLPERIEVSLISEIATGTCAPPPNVLREAVDVSLPPMSPLQVSPLSFSLLTTEGSLADLIAPDQARWADWTDGLNMLRRDGGHVASQETAGFVQALTEIGLKIKLLDLSGEKVEIPSGLTAGPPPNNTEYFFSDLAYDMPM